jgi:PPOX class probable F420-dependent enzyme
MPLSPDEVDEFLRQPIVAVMATVGPDGAPHAVPTWFDYEDGEIVLHMGSGSRRYRNLQGNSGLTLVVDTKTPPYKVVVAQGRVCLDVGTDDDRAVRMAVRYLSEEIGRAYAKGVVGTEMVIARLRPDKIVSWDYGRGDRP